VAGQNLLSRLATTAWTRRYPEVSLSHPDRENPHLELTVLSLPRLAADHARLAIARRRDGIVGQPWITATSKTFLETMLQPTDVGLEFGSGGSTAWLARLVAFVYSVDAFEKWHRPLA
jgi:hypothetical protein